MNIKPEIFPDTGHRIEHVQPDKKEKFHGTFKGHRGHTLFKYNPVTNEMEIAEYELLPADFRNPKKVKKKVIMEKGCEYISALNKQNAARKLGVTLKNINEH
jgi:hypothetical protein